MVLNEFLDKYIKLTDAKSGKISVLPAATASHFETRNSRSQNEKEKYRISRPKLEEVRKYFPEAVAEYEANHKVVTADIEEPLKSGIDLKAGSGDSKSSSSKTGKGGRR